MKNYRIHFSCPHTFQVVTVIQSANNQRAAIQRARRKVKKLAGACYEYASDALAFAAIWRRGQADAAQNGQDFDRSAYIDW